MSTIHYLTDFIEHKQQRFEKNSINAEIILKAFKSARDSSEKKMQLVMIGNRNNEYLRLADELGLLNVSVISLL